MSQKRKIRLMTRPQPLWGLLPTYSFWKALQNEHWNLSFVLNLIIGGFGYWIAMLLLPFGWVFYLMGFLIGPTIAHGLFERILRSAIEARRRRLADSGEFMKAIADAEDAGRPALLRGRRLHDEEEKDINAP